MLAIHALASGSKGNAFIVRNNDDCLLIDCGTTQTYLRTAMNSIGIKTEDIDAVLITHHHTDHIAQLSMFKAKPIYAHCDLKVECKKIEVLEYFKVKNFRIMAIPMSHDAENTVGYIIEVGDEKLIYITDTGYIQEKHYQYLKDADYIVLEFNHDLKMLMETNRPMFLKQRIQGDCGHLCNEDGAIVLANIVGSNTKEIWLAHLSEEANTPDKALAVAQTALSRMPYQNIKIEALRQYKVQSGGKTYEADYGSHHSYVGDLECSFNFNDA